jgi:tetratricopeptide (TPR) repeat protein
MSIAAWDQAIPVLERFRAAWPDSRWQGEVTRNLSVALLESGQLSRAADEFGRLGQQQDDPETARAALWQSAELYMRAEQAEKSLQAYQRYITAHPQPLDQAIEARRRIAEAYRDRRDGERQRHWLNEIIAADTRAGAARTDFSQATAAAAAIELAEPLRERYRNVRLVTPLDRSLKEKRAAMDDALKAYRRAADYGVAGVTTAATFHTGEIYHELSRSLLESQRPAGLSAEEMEQYDILLEEQAYPFEEEAIKLHEVNHRRIAQGVYDEWVKLSMEQLAALLPARYGKSEILESAIETIH